MIKPYLYLKKIFILLCLLSLITACTYKDRVQPIALSDMSVINGLHVSALSYEDIQQAKETFGFNIRKAGLLPVGISFENEGTNNIKIISDQTFIIDNKNQAWPVNTSERTAKRIEKHVDIGETAAGAAKPALLMGAVGAVSGLAIGIITGDDIGEAIGKGAAIGAAAGAISGGVEGYMNTKEKIQNDLENKKLENKTILPNQIGYGILFFPGYKEEAASAEMLKLSLSFDGQIKTINIPVTK